MINREISYERNVNKSYMKIPAIVENNFDETVMLKKQILGLIPVEKCYVNGAGQYWYNISGKQALDAYCRVNAVGNTFFENLILRFCEEAEILEWNLLDVNCLVLDPELIFVSHNGEDVSFVVYPDNKGELFLELQQLMEYLLTKLNHNDGNAVSAAYKIYELTLSEGISIADLKKYILDSRIEKMVINEQTVSNIGKAKDCKVEEDKLSHALKNDGTSKTIMETKTIEEKIAQFLDSKIAMVYEKIGRVLEMTPFEFHKERKDKKEKIPEIIYPEDEEEEVFEVVHAHPTVCIGGELAGPRGVLVCEAKGEFSDFQLEKETAIIGKNPKVKFCLDRETVSQFHARIEYLDGGYYIEDLNSTNGTYVNDVLLNYKQRYRLTTGDCLKFADVLYHFY